MKKADVKSNFKRVIILNEKYIALISKYSQNNCNLTVIYHSKSKE